MGNRANWTDANPVKYCQRAVHLKLFGLEAGIMCGIFGILSPEAVPWGEIRALAQFAQRRGSDASGFYYWTGSRYNVLRADLPVRQLARLEKRSTHKFVMGHSRLVTNGESDNQPICLDDVAVIHNGIVVNEREIWATIDMEPQLETDTESIAALIQQSLITGCSELEAATRVLDLCQGSVSAAVALPRIGKLCLFTNTGSLFIGVKDQHMLFASERSWLGRLGCEKIQQVSKPMILDIPTDHDSPEVTEIKAAARRLVPTLKYASSDIAQLTYHDYGLRRCERCILPESMPFIAFDDDGVCNYCHAYVPRNAQKPIEELDQFLQPYRRAGQIDCIVPFSGGRDSSYALHLAVKELGMTPVAYTYDWGMITDLGRRNVSRMCGALNVENIVVADDIQKKRRNIALNLAAWLEAPHLGLLGLLTAGDKHFYRHIEPIKKELGISLNLWGVNPLEVTYFKAGFLGIPPNFHETTVYQRGWQQQFRYQFLRLRAMKGSRKYFNRSLWDTLSGEYYRSIRRKSDYAHLFDYYSWNEQEVESALAAYDWERAPDSKSTWRIGDATAAFYNYVYYSIAGFTEHDTFRSNQVREGQLDRQTALSLVAEENHPRYANIRWYLDALGGFDFSAVLRRINQIPKVWEEGSHY